MLQEFETLKMQNFREGRVEQADVPSAILRGDADRYAGAMNVVNRAGKVSASDIGTI